jgi:hypothetical protein
MTGLHDNAARFKNIHNLSLGRAIVFRPGSLITEHGNNEVAMAATTFLMPFPWLPWVKGNLFYFSRTGFGDLQHPQQAI